MAKAPTMAELMANMQYEKLEPGSITDGKIIAVRKNEIIVDLGARGTGMVPRREIGFSKKYQVGEEVSVFVVDPELPSGQILLSIRKAAKERGWDEVQKVVTAGKPIVVKPYDANRGGLLIEYEGVRGFMPLSQLSTEHYPRTNDKVEIARRLKELVGKDINVQIIDADQKGSKLIFSEKEAVKDGLANRLTSLKVGDIVEGVVTGIVDFGAFVNVDGIEGLIHISEVSWERISEVKDCLKTGQKIKAKIISIDKDRLSLSIKQTTPDPWINEVKEFKVGQKVEGTVVRITPFGAFVQISPSIEALIHVSELGKDADPDNIFSQNEKREFSILEIDAENHKIRLGFTK